jgi:hypothetical protein
MRRKNMSRSSAFCKRAKLTVPLAALTGLLVLTLLSCGGQKKSGPVGPSTVGTKTPITFTFYNDELTRDLPFTDPIA